MNSVKKNKMPMDTIFTIFFHNVILNFIILILINLFTQCRTVADRVLKNVHRNMLLKTLIKISKAWTLFL